MAEMVRPPAGGEGATAAEAAPAWAAFDEFPPRPEHVAAAFAPGSKVWVRQGQKYFATGVVAADQPDHDHDHDHHDHDHDHGAENGNGADAASAEVVEAPAQKDVAASGVASVAAGGDGGRLKIEYRDGSSYRCRPARLIRVYTSPESPPATPVVLATDHTDRYRQLAKTQLRLVGNCLFTKAATLGYMHLRKFVIQSMHPHPTTIEPPS